MFDSISRQSKNCDKEKLVISTLRDFQGSLRIATMSDEALPNMRQKRQDQ